MTDSRKLAAQMPGFPGRAAVIAAELTRRIEARQRGELHIAETLSFADVDTIVPKTKTATIVDKPERRRVCATYCPTCGGWVEVRLHPVQLHCTGCGVEARP